MKLTLPSQTSSPTSGPRLLLQPQNWLSPRGPKRLKLCAIFAILCSKMSKNWFDLSANGSWGLWEAMHLIAPSIFCASILSSWTNYVDPSSALFKAVLPSFTNNAPHSLKRLQPIVETLEEGSVGLEDVLRLYEAGVALSKRCLTQLQQVELRLKKLSKDMNGRFQLSDEAVEE